MLNKNDIKIAETRHDYDTPNRVIVLLEQLSGKFKDLNKEQ